MIFHNFYFCILIVTFFSSLTNAEVWTDYNQWNTKWENEKGEWIKNQIEEDVFTNFRSPYYGIPTDCADAGYILHLLFAWENKLPFQITDKTSIFDNEKGFRKITNKMSRWDSKSLEKSPFESIYKSTGEPPHRIEAFRNLWNNFSLEKRKLWYFIHFVASMTSTYSVSRDMIASPLSLTEIRPGDLIVERRKHMRVIKNIDSYGVILHYTSTQPLKVRPLKFDSYFEITATKENEDGIMRFRRPEELGVHYSKIKRFSPLQYELWSRVKRNENYSINESNKSNMRIGGFEKALRYGFEEFPGIARSIEPLSNSVNRLHNSLCQYVKDRVEVVLSGLEYSQRKGTCLNQSEYDDYSTTSRDKRIFNRYSHFVGHVEDLKKTGEWEEFDDKNLKMQIELLLDSKEHEQPYAYFDTDPFLSEKVAKNDSLNLKDNSDYIENCQIYIDPNNSELKLGLKEVIYRLRRGFISSNPNTPLQVRWGYETDNSECPKFED